MITPGYKSPTYEPSNVISVYPTPGYEGDVTIVID